MARQKNIFEETNNSETITETYSVTFTARILSLKNQLFLNHMVSLQKKELIIMGILIFLLI